MEWIAAISTNIFFAIILWLSRSLIITRLTNSVKHEYDKKLENLKADIQSKSSQIDALRNGTLSGITTRQTAIFQRQLAAIEQVWGAIISLEPAKSASTWIATIKFEEALEEAEKNPKFREIFSAFSKIDLNNLPINQAQQARPFISPLAWAYYTAYQAIIADALIRLHMLKDGINLKEIINTNNVKNLIKIALPHRIEKIERFGHSIFHHLLDELENNLLVELQKILKGDDTDSDSLEKAAAIIKQSELLMESNAKLNQGK
ncbi:hypothetical protein [Chromobacterium rhizoryzae]|uniref:hypothetical protein n=1 Tax=Chromobacterium rhizoryzae TaxID=1778675 RepID=UPI001D086233|nr:hypothetical protein [Chromobacterium rhizoryzae]